MKFSGYKNRVSNFKKNDLTLKVKIKVKFSIRCPPLHPIKFVWYFSYDALFLKYSHALIKVGHPVDIFECWLISWLTRRVTPDIKKSAIFYINLLNDPLDKFSVGFTIFKYTFIRQEKFKKSLSLPFLINWWFLKSLFYY